MRRPFGDKIRLARKKKGFSLIDVIEKLKDKKITISISYLSQMEIGKREPPNEEIVKGLAKVLELSQLELLKIARTDRDKIELGMLNLGPKKREMAIALQRSWTELSEDDAQKIENILAEIFGG